MRQRLLELLRFGAVGLACLLLGVLVLAALHELAGLNYLVAYIAAFVVTNATGYLLNARFTFSAESVSHLGAARYMMVNAALLLVNTAGLKVLVDELHVWYLLAAALLGVVSTPATFVIHRLVTYRLTSARTSGEI